mmetsp:Transcript_33026/g.74150  ORF Transcript_33026/g.74150 Transcript_33026/m.74150 type:complete len:238 (+) Transcript_33026:1347-2060(+)
MLPTKRSPALERGEEVLRRHAGAEEEGALVMLEVRMDALQMLLQLVHLLAVRMASLLLVLHLHLRLHEHSRALLEVHAREKVSPDLAHTVADDPVPCQVRPQALAHVLPHLLEGRKLKPVLLQVRVCDATCPHQRVQLQDSAEPSSLESALRIPERGALKVLDPPAELRAEVNRPAEEFDVLDLEGHSHQGVVLHLVRGDEVREEVGRGEEAIVRVDLASEGAEELVQARVSLCLDL